MATDDPWGAFPDADPAPAAQSPFGGRPVIRKMGDPYAEENQQLKREDARRREMEWNATHNPDGSPKAQPVSGAAKLSAKERADAVQAYSDADALERLAADLAKQYAAGPGATTGIEGIQDYLPTPTNKTFDTTANQARGRVKRALGFTGGEGNTIGEVQLNYGPFIPQASDYDATIKGKIKSLRDLANDSRTRAIAVLGGKPDINGVVTPVGQESAPTVQRQVYKDAPGALELATDYKRSDDPALSGLKGEYLNRLQSGQSATQLIKWMKDAGVKITPSLTKSVGEQARFRRQNPDVPVEKYNIDQLDDVFTPTTTYQRTMGAAAQNPFGAAAMAAGNAVSGGYMPDIIGATGGNEEQARIALNDAGNQHPWATMAGGLAGGVTATLSGEAALGGAGMGAGFGRSLLADTGYGAFAGSGGSPEDRTGGATWGMAAGALGSTVGQGLTRGGARVLRGVTNPEVNRLANEGIDMTLGSVVSQSGTTGKIVKGVEDGLTSLPGVGDMVAGRKIEGIRQFNSKAFDKALEPIGAKVGDAVGEAAIEKAHQAVKGAFSDALKGRQAIPDDDFVKAARGPLERLAGIKRNDLGGEIVGQIEDATQDLFDPNTGALSGENMQTFLEALRQIKQSYKSDPLFPRVIKPSIDGISNAVEGMFARQAPEVMPKFNAAKAAYRRLSVMADAVTRGKNTDGIFMPSQLGDAATANAKKFDGKIAAATDSRPFFDLQRAGQNVLPSKMPDSGTARRAAQIAGVGLLPGVGAAGSYATGSDPATGAGVGLGVIGVLGLLYTRGGQKRISSILLNRSPRARAIAEEMKKRASLAGAGSTALIAGPDQ